MPINRHLLKSENDSIIVSTDVEPVEVTGTVNVMGVIGSGDSVYVEPGVDPIVVEGTVNANATISSATSSIKVEPGTASIETNATISSATSSIKVEPGTASIETNATISSATSSIKVEPGSSPIIITPSSSVSTTSNYTTSSVAVEPGTGTLYSKADSNADMQFLGSIYTSAVTSIFTGSGGTQHYIPTNTAPTLTLPDGHDNLAIVMYFRISDAGSTPFSNLISALVYPDLDFYNNTAGSLTGRPAVANDVTLAAGAFFTGPGNYDIKAIITHGPDSTRVWDAMTTSGATMYVTNTSGNPGLYCQDLKSTDYTSFKDNSILLGKNIRHTLQYTTSVNYSQSGFIRVEYYSFKGS